MFDRHFGVWPEYVPQHLTLPQTSVFSNLEISARRYPKKNAIVYYDSCITYEALLRDVEALAGYLQQAGVQKGDRVLLYMQNAPQFIISYFAILRANAVVVPVNPMNRSIELEHYVADTSATVCICGQELFGFIEPLLGGVSHLERIVVAAYSDAIKTPTGLDLPAEVRAPGQAVSHPQALAWNDALSANHAPGPLLVGPDDLAVFPYSSGTTGAPKGCMHTHGSVMATAVHGVVWAHSTCEAIVLATLPYFHVTGMQSAMNGPIYSGGTIVLMTRWDRKVAAELIQKHRVTRWVNIATMAIDFLSAPDVDQYDLSSLTSISGGGAAMPKAIEAKLHDLTGLHYIEGYGLSETIAATHLNPIDRPKAQCLGIPVFDVDSRIIEIDTGEQKGPNEVGEIVTHGPQLFRGYWNRPDETARAFIEIDGKAFFRTGDMGYYDEEGYFFLVDRVKRMINASGFKVWPSEVESLMYRHPAIRECCIISSPHPRRGETVKACIVLRDDQVGNVTEEEVIAWCKEEMAAYKVPASVVFVDALPRSPTGKLMWRQLQEDEWANAKQ